MSQQQKAWFYNEYGSIDVLQFGEIPVPKPGPGQLLLKIRAAALNPSDVRRREGLLRGADSEFPVLICVHSSIFFNISFFLSPLASMTFHNIKN